MRASVLAALLLVAACGTATAPVAVPPTPTPRAAASPRVLVPGTLYALPQEPLTLVRAIDGASVASVWRREGPSPYLSRLLLTDLATGTTRHLVEADADLPLVALRDGVVAYLDYRDDGMGAWNGVVATIDTKGTRGEIDRFALSAATFHGGGGGPRRPSWAIALGGGRIAWNRLVEIPGGDIRGELRVAPATGGAATVIASSTKWVMPIAVDMRRLVYVLRGASADEIHVRDLATNADRVVASGAVLFDVAASGKWVVYDEGTDEQRGPKRVRLVDLDAGTTRALQEAGNVDAGFKGLVEGSCGDLSANERYVTWWCDPRAPGEPLMALDLATQQRVPLATGTTASADRAYPGAIALDQFGGDPYVLVLPR